MPFTPSNPVIAGSWTADTNGSASTWASDAITEVYDLLTDIDGNHIVDSYGNYISLGGGFVVDTASVASTIPATTSGSATTWTPEG